MFNMFLFRCFYVLFCLCFMLMICYVHFCYDFPVAEKGIKNRLYANILDKEYAICKHSRKSLNVFVVLCSALFFCCLFLFAFMYCLCDAFVSFVSFLRDGKL